MQMIPQCLSQTLVSKDWKALNEKLPYEKTPEQKKLGVTFGLFFGLVVEAEKGLVEANSADCD